MDICVCWMRLNLIQKVLHSLFAWVDSKDAGLIIKAGQRKLLNTLPLFREEKSILCTFPWQVTAAVPSKLAVSDLQALQGLSLLGCCRSLATLFFPLYLIYCSTGDWLVWCHSLLSVCVFKLDTFWLNDFSKALAACGAYMVKSTLV